MYQFLELRVPHQLFLVSQVLRVLHQLVPASQVLLALHQLFLVFIQLVYLPKVLIQLLVCQFQDN